MPSLEEVRLQLKSIDGATRFLGFREIKELPAILWHDEVVEQLVTGFYGNGNGVLVATNKRLVFVDKGLVFGLRVEDFPYEKITSIQYKIGLLFGEITIFASGNRADIKNVAKDVARSFAEHARARMTPIAASHSASAHSTQGSDAIVAALERLATLKSQGILTESEFESQKARILRT
jgi:hypothetical protein